jgi:hypothetical protein
LTRGITLAVMKNLVLARVGSRSLHPEWLGQCASRTWDLQLLPYEPIPFQPLDVTVHDVLPGPKWSGLNELLDTWDGWREYDYVWLPDDDILTTSRQIDRLFDAAHLAGLDLFAPALASASYFAHFDTMRNDRFHGRWVGFVEIMCPGFRRSALERLLPTFALSETGWGWGLDSVWPKLLHYRNVGVLDGVPVTHTRPVGAMRDPDLRQRVHAESDRLLAAFGCAQVHTTFGAFDDRFEALDRTGDALVADLTAGWQYLIDRDPRVLKWIMAFQGPDARCPDYPGEGTPGGGYARP